MDCRSRPLSGQFPVKTYTTVGTVGPAALLGGLVDLDVLDNQVASVKALRVGVGLGVLQQLEEEFGRLDGPPGTGHTPLLACLSTRQPSESFQAHKFPNCTPCSCFCGLSRLVVGISNSYQGLQHPLEPSSHAYTPMTALDNFAFVNSFVPWAVRPMEPA